MLGCMVKDQRKHGFQLLLYGIGIERSWSLQEIADLLGISHERVRCIRDCAIKRLK